MIYNSVGAAEDGIFLWGRAFHSFTKHQGKLQRSHLCTRTHSHELAFLHRYTNDSRIREDKPMPICAHWHIHLFLLLLQLPVPSLHVSWYIQSMNTGVSKSGHTAAEYSALRSHLLPLSPHLLPPPLSLHSYSTSSSICRHRCLCSLCSTFIKGLSSDSPSYNT